MRRTAVATSKMWLTIQPMLVAYMKSSSLYMLVEDYDGK